MTRLLARIEAARSARGRQSRTVMLLGVLLGFESVLYSVVTPVLPHYQHQFSASKPAIGLLAAAYPAGMLPGSLLGGWMATRVGVRRTTVLGLLLFSVSVAPFGFGAQLGVLDGLRFVQGIGCGCVWGGGLAWAIASAPRGRRNQTLGSVFASALFGTLIGPVLGTLAVAIGTGVVFACVGGVSLVLAGWTLRFPDPPPARLGAGAPIRAVLKSSSVVLSFWLILLEACTIGALGTLLSLRLSRFGASGVAIGVTFVVASLLSTVLTPLLGRVVDRRGNTLPMTVGLALSGVLIALLPVPHTGLILAALTVLTLGGPLIASTIPAMALMTDSIEAIGAALAFGSMLLNVAWSLGETLGAPAAASLSHATSDAVPMALLAAAMLVTLVPVLRMRSPSLQPGRDQPEVGAALVRSSS
jgi:MFS family permease